MTKFLLVLILFTIIAPPKAHAYLDPGSGSYAIQILIAFFLGAGVMLRGHLSSVTNFFKKTFGKKKKDENK